MYSQDYMNIQSSVAERCIMSLQSFMAGFMPPQENRNPLPIPWQPFGMKVIPREKDMILTMKKPCPKYDKMLNDFYTNATGAIKELNSKNRQLYDFLTKHTGKNITNLRDVEFLYNTLSIENDEGLKLPDWTDDVFPDKLRPLAERHLQLLTETPYMTLVKGGAMVTEITNGFLDKQMGSNHPDRRINIYSAHDVTLINTFKALGIVDQTTKKPDYSSALVFELHRSFIYNDDYEVQV